MTYSSRWGDNGQYLPYWRVWLMLRTKDNLE